MTVTPEQVAARLRAEGHARQRAARARAAGLEARLVAAAARLRADGAVRVWLFGSLAAGEPSAASDVDLAVEGMAAASYFPALADLMELLGTRVDLVRLEQAPPSLVERVRSSGRELP